MNGYAPPVQWSTPSYPGVSPAAISCPFHGASEGIDDIGCPGQRLAVNAPGCATNPAATAIRRYHRGYPGTSRTAETRSGPRPTHRLQTSETSSPSVKASRLHRSIAGRPSLCRDPQVRHSRACATQRLQSSSSNGAAHRPATPRRGTENRCSPNALVLRVPQQLRRRRPQVVPAMKVVAGFRRNDTASAMSDAAPSRAGNPRGSWAIRIANAPDGTNNVVIGAGTGHHRWARCPAVVRPMSGSHL